ncbi:MAG: SRPBCC family protein [Actinomycetota bacterium]|nr:SRPBCC family protein [Actinomycetota bacterium]
MLSREVDAPPSVVWRVLTDWERQAEWMVDARAVRVTGDRRQGTGVELRVPTRVVGVTVQDTMRVTVWEPPRMLGVRHTGRLISGVGAFVLEPVEGGTRLVWWEEVDPPLGALGELGASLVVRPYLARLFGRSLDAFARICHREASRGQQGARRDG